MSSSVKKRLGALVFSAILAALVLTVPLTGFAADINNQGQTFISVAEVARAEQLASKTAGQPAPEVIAAMQAEKQAYAALQAAIQSGDSQAIAAAQAAMIAAEVTAETVMAQACAVTPADIGAMRGSGMGWGQIAQELGVQPASLGLGNFSRHQSAMMQATSRGIRGGQSMMHGVHSDNFSGSRGMGLDHAAQNYGGWANFSGARGGDHAGGSGSGHGMVGSMKAGYDANHGKSMDSGMNGGWGASHDGGTSADSSPGGGHGGGMGSGASGGHGGGSSSGPGDGHGGGSGSGGGHGGGSGGNGPGGGSGGGSGSGSGGGSGGGCR